jgi:hypothetical protein
VVSPCRTYSFGDDQDQRKQHTTQTTPKDEGKDSGNTTKDEGKDSGTDTTDCSYGCLTVTRSCYCDGVMADDSECPSLDELSLTENLDCSLNCDDCEWTNLSEWSPCEDNTQFLTRECSCEEEDVQSSDQSSDDESYSYSSFCNGYTRIFQSCETDIEALTVEDWKTESWPLKGDTEMRTFTCSSLTWSDLMKKSSLDDWESLAVEVIAAHLNILSGVSTTEKLREDLESADKLLLNCTWSKEQTKETETLLTSLGAFNKGEVKKISNAKEEDGEEMKANSNSNSNSPQLLLLILIPAVLLVIGIIVVTVVLIRKKVQKESVNTTL